MIFFAVLDTNVLVSSLLTKHKNSATARVIDAVSTGKIVPLYNKRILEEYDDVLHRAKFPFSSETASGIVEMIRQFGLAVSPNPTGAILPDMDDLIFYEVVMEKQIDDGAYLITGNIKHFPRRTFIVTPAEMMAILDTTAQRE